MADIEISYITLPSRWGRDMRYKHYKQGSDTLAVLFPGNNYSAELPLLHYAGRVAVEYGCDCLQLEYGFQSARAGIKREDWGLVAEECGQALSGIAAPYRRLLFISKSIGTMISGSISEKLAVPAEHLYLTPLPETVPFIRRTGGMVIYGSADPLFPESLAAELKGVAGVGLYRIEDANHSLEAGSVNESLAVLMVINNWYHEFFAAHTENHST